MKVLEVIVHNLCGVDHREVTFHPEDGVVTLTGTNGSGKSTVLSAVRWLLTGQLPKAHPTKERFQRKEGVTPATPSYAKLVFSTDSGAKYRITGYLSSSKWSLESLDGPELVEGRSLIEARLGDLLSCDLTSLSRFSFIEQGTLQSVLFGSKADRVKSFHLLLGLDSVERIRTRLYELQGLVHVEELTTIIESLLERCEELDSRRAELVTKVAEAENTVEAIDAVHARHGDAQWVHIAGSYPHHFDLNQLQGGRTLALGSHSVPANDYDRIRIHMTAAHLVMADGAEVDVPLPDGGLHVDVPMGRRCEVVGGSGATVSLDFRIPTSFQHHADESWTCVPDVVVDDVWRHGQNGHHG